jgi:hypothetical protein
MIIPRKILAKYGCMINIKDFKKKQKTCFYVSGYSTSTMYVYLDIWRFFSPIFCDVAKVMIIPRKILAKYGYMVNIKFL